MVSPEPSDRSTLLAVVGASAAARRSLEHVAAIAVGLGAPVHLLVVGAGGPAPEGVGWTADRVAAYAADRLHHAGVEVEVELVARALVQRVVEAARDASLVILGREGEDDRLPEQVMARVDAPLLVVRDGPGRSSAAYRVVLAIRDAYDVSPDVEAVARLARAVEVEALVVHVPEIRGAAFGSHLELGAEGAVAAAVNRLGSLGVPAQGRTVAPSLEPALTLCWIADEWDATLVVVNSRRTTGLLGRFVQSTAREMIRHGSRPVLLTARG